LRRKAAGFNKSLASAATKGCHRKFLCLEDRAVESGVQRDRERGGRGGGAGRQLPCHVLDARATATWLQYVTTHVRLGCLKFCKLYTPAVSYKFYLRYSRPPFFSFNPPSAIYIIKDNERSNSMMSPYVLLIHCNERLMAWHFSYCQFYQWHKACNYSYFPNSADLCKPECIECLHRYPTPIMRNSIYVHSPMRKTLPMFYDTPRLSSKIGRVCINNNRKPVESYFIALRRMKMSGYDRNVSRTCDIAPSELVAVSISCFAMAIASKQCSLHLQVLINMNEYIARDRISQSSDLIIVDSRTQSALHSRQFELIDELPYPITLWTGMDEDNT
ncbi:hypothetical protein ALC56_12491, partial [Trachymyrmex septentrionalis]